MATAALGGVPAGIESGRTDGRCRPTAPAAEQARRRLQSPDTFFPGFWDGTVGILLTQVEMGERMAGMIDEFQALPPPS